jgi:Ca-activated chloride channel family protein
MTRRFSALCTALVVMAFASSVWAQGFLISNNHAHRMPRPWPMPTPDLSVMNCQVKELAIQARLKDQVAQVQVSQTFLNTGSTQLEAQFVYPLPYDGAIDRLTLMVDGKEYPAQLLSKEEARGRYEAIVRSSKDPALLEWMGQGMFQTSVFPVPPGQTRTVTLHYNQLLRKDRGTTDFLFPLGAAKYTTKPLEKLDLQVSIDSTVSIRNVYSPSHTVAVERPDEDHAVVKYTATNTVPGSDFRLFFDVNPDKLGTSLLSYRPNANEDGYFLLLTTPQVPKQNVQLPKTVLFVVDKSGSMQGEKIDQAKAALKFVLNNLHEGDTFNIVAYDTAVETFRPELERINEETRKQATGYVNGLYAGGGTNIHDALKTALEQIKDTTRPTFVLFMTDGLPTVGERNEAKIAQAAREANKSSARILNFGVGYDVNSRLLDRLAREHSGASEYVRPNEDIEVHVSKVYSKISSPVLANVNVKFEFDQVATEAGPPVNRIYPSGKFDLFAGEQVVLLGRYKHSGVAKVVIEGNVGRESQHFDFPVDFAQTSANSTFGFVEKLWAMRRIGEIIDELDLNGKNEELVKELVLLSTKHGILTPYTSFLADETSRPTLARDSDEFLRNSGISRSRLGDLEEAEGQSGVAQRSGKQLFKGRSNLDAAAPAAPAAGGSGFGGRGTGARSATPSSGPMLAAPAPAAAPGAQKYIDSKTDREVLTSNVQQIGNQTAYRRGKRIVTPETADLDCEKDKAQIVTIQRYSKEYFDLVAKNTADDNLLIAQQGDDEELLAKFRGQAYLIQ